VTCPRCGTEFTVDWGTPFREHQEEKTMHDNHRHMVGAGFPSPISARYSRGGACLGGPLRYRLLKIPRKNRFCSYFFGESSPPRTPADERPDDRLGRGRGLAPSDCSIRFA
jgi:hypothetical protein